MYDTIIIGAGAAGLAAGRMLHDAGQKVLILEAMNRIGGRIFTDEFFVNTSIPVELGAEFIHGENAATHRLLQHYGFSTTDAPRYKNMWWAWDKLACARAELPEDAQKTLSALDDAYSKLKDEDFSPRHEGEGLGVRVDISLADYLRQKGFDAEAIAYADIYFAQTCCASIESLSIADLAREMRLDTAGKEEFRVQGGYSAFLKKYSEGLAIQLGEAVERIEQAEFVTLISEKARYQAKTVLVTASIKVLQRGIIEFSPALSPQKQAAIHAMKMQGGTKLIYLFDKPYWDERMVYLLHRGLAPRWWTNGNVISCFLTADAADFFDKFSQESEALEIGLKELSTILNQPDLAKHCIAAKWYSWKHQPFVGGGYAHVPAGAANARLELAKPEGKVFFAGEATAHHSNPQTVHGALESGWRAAREILQQLNEK
jgi:monoamine oxidase